MSTSELQTTGCPKCRKPVVLATKWGHGEMDFDPRPSEQGTHRIYIGHDGKVYCETLITRQRFGRRELYTRHKCRR